MNSGRAEVQRFVVIVGFLLGAAALAVAADNVPLLGFGGTRWVLKTTELPAAAGVNAGAMVAISDCTTNVRGAIAVGGGAVFAMVLSNGANWVVV
jgi:ABC-type transporter Mla subunit MlaD